LFRYVGIIPVAVAAAMPANTASAADGLQMEQLPVPAGVVNSDVRGGDHSGRFLVGAGLRFDGTEGRQVVLRWDNGTVSELDTAALAPAAHVEATDINNDGIVVGFRVRDFSTFHTDAWIHRNGGFSLLPGLETTDETSAVAINARGDVVGQSGERAVIWPADHPGTVRELTVDASSPMSSTGVDIDDDGTVLGFLGCRPCEEQRPYIWPADGPGYPLAAPAGTGYPEGVAIRNGWVAGAAVADYRGVAVRWDLRAETASVISTEHGSAAAVNRRGTVAASDALLYRNGRVQVLNGYVTVLTDQGTAAGSDAPYLSGNAVVWS
jgi:uncharacterized membrane protein